MFALFPRSIAGSWCSLLWALHSSHLYSNEIAAAVQGDLLLKAEGDEANEKSLHMIPSARTPMA